jgi:hypothetical protein
MGLALKLPTKKVRKICFALLLFIFSGVDNIASPTLTIGQGTGDQNTSGLVPVSFSDEDPIVAMQFDVQFDDTLLEVRPVLLQTLSTNQIVISGQPANGVQRVVIYSLNNAPLPNGVLLNLQFRAGFFAQNGTAALTPANVILANAAAQRLGPVTLNSGSFLISSVAVAEFVSASIQNGSVELQLMGKVGDTFVLQTSADLIGWSSISTNNIPSGGVLKFIDSGVAPNRARFYRAQQQQTP